MNTLAPRFQTLFRLLPLWLAVLLAGCGKSTPAASKEPVVVVAEANEVDGSDETEIELTKKLEAKRKAAAANPASKMARPSRPAVAAVPEPGPGEQRCFDCAGKGRVACTAPGCREGWLACPGRCLKRQEGTWVPDPKHGGMARAMKVPDGRTYYIPEYHAGEIWVYQGGQLVSQGDCPPCGGSRRIECRLCGASGKTPCPLCETKGVIPAAWRPNDNPWFNRQPDVVRLKDGRVFLAKDAGGDDVIVMFKTRAGEIISVARSEVAQWPKKL